MKESLFNIYYKMDSGEKIAFNSKGCGLAIVDDSYEKLLSILSDVKDENDVPAELMETFSAAKEGFFITDDDCDELADLNIKRNFQKYNTNSLGLTIAPTLACNFKCPYCYETSKPGIMDETTEKNLLTFVEKQIEVIKHLSISWYGGEPLLALKTIESISDKLIKLCEEHNVAFDAYIISNGYLLNDEIIEKLIKYKVGGIQITVDGPPEIHNQRRKSKSGVPTFDVILENINKLLKTEKINVMVRINVDKGNSENISALMEIFKNRLISKRVKFSFGQVTAYTEACKSIESSCYNNSEFAKEIITYYSIVQKYGFGEYNPLPYPEPKLNYCCADIMNSFVVDPEGYLYKCWNQVGETNRAVGNLNVPSTDIVSYKNAFWVERNPVVDEKCKSCKILPICMGGCPYSSLVLKEKNSCDLIKYNIKDVMTEYYNSLREE